jgi:hypothetical protein
MSTHLRREFPISKQKRYRILRLLDMLCGEAIKKTFLSSI